jgi:hypothetical protein
MNRFLILSFLVLSLPAYAAEEQPQSRRLLHIAQPVFSNLNGDGTWNGYVQVQESPCQDQPMISTQFGFTKVKNKDEVFTHIADQLDATEKQAEELEKLCKK